MAAFADAWEVGDVDRIVSLLTEDSWLTMPPLRSSTRATRRSPPSSRAIVRHPCGPGGRDSSRPAPTPSRRSRATSPDPHGGRLARDRADRAHARGRSHLGPHRLLRLGRVRPLRPAADAAGGLAPRTAGAGLSSLRSAAAARRPSSSSCCSSRRELLGDRPSPATPRGGGGRPARARSRPRSARPGSACRRPGPGAGTRGPRPARSRDGLGHRLRLDAFAGREVADAGRPFAVQPPQHRPVGEREAVLGPQAPDEAADHGPQLAGDQGGVREVSWSFQQVA